ncbi:MAG TPA: type 4a pilus biogenesis protein PilO [Thermoanaerobaculia bacterium]|nr:type 4a pilus biogenesis protein PilO [Thermoanaerobaculia bacterium]
MRQFVLILIALALPPTVYFQTLGEKRERQSRMADSAILDLDRRIEQSRAAQRKITQFHEELDRLAVENEKLRRILPPDLSVGEIRALIDANASQTGVRIARFEPRKPVKDVYTFLSIDMEVIGNAGATSEFLRRTSDATTILNTSAMTIRKDPAGWRTDFVMTAYALPD